MPRAGARSSIGRSPRVEEHTGWETLLNRLWQGVCDRRTDCRWWCLMAVTSKECGMQPSPYPPYKEGPFFPRLQRQSFLARICDRMKSV